MKFTVVSVFLIATVSAQCPATLFTDYKSYAKTDCTGDAEKIAEADETKTLKGYNDAMSPLVNCSTTDIRVTGLKASGVKSGKLVCTATAYTPTYYTDDKCTTAVAATVTAVADASKKSTVTLGKCFEKGGKGLMLSSATKTGAALVASAMAIAASYF